ncbi:MAG TPA: helix-turn-helix domain-containing protein, partial [Candidatus Methylomirabilis sp.]|nr:helix-turn-helix domain-containing protein [Candidatus Methylomirabilis sp.]
MGTQERRAREREERGRQILAAARQLFWKQGFSRTTMPEIAAAAELAPGTLYLYFPSKDALYIELLIEGYAKLLADLQTGASRAGSPARQAAALIDAFLRFAQTEPQYFDIIFFVLQREVGGPTQALHPHQLERLQAAEAACKAVAAAILRHLPGPKSDAALQVTVDAVWSMLVGVVFFWRRDGEPSFSTVATRARALILQAFFGPRKGATR